MFTQLNYMEKRGSGLRKMWELTEKLPNFIPGKKPKYQTEATSFYTTFFNLNWNKDGMVPMEEIASRATGSHKDYPINDKDSVEKVNLDKKSSEKRFGDYPESSERRFGDNIDRSKKIGKTAQKIIDFVISDPSISAEAMAYKIGISSRAVEKQIAKLRSMGILSREGADFGGYWRIVINPQTEQ